MSSSPKKRDLLEFMRELEGMPRNPPCIGIVSSTHEECENGDTRITDCVGDDENCTEWIRASATLTLEDWR